MIMMPLDFTSFFVGGLIVGLLLILIGIWLRRSFPKSSGFGTLIILLGALPALAGGFLLVAEPAANWWQAFEYTSWTQQLPKDRVIQGIKLPRGTKVEWYGRRPAILSASTKQPIDAVGLSLVGDLKFRISNNKYTRTRETEDESMYLELGTLAADRIIDGVPCGAHAEVEFDFDIPDAGPVPKAVRGKLVRCTLSSVFEFGGNRYQAGSEVRLTAFHTVQYGVLADDQDVNGHRCKGGTEIERPNDHATRFTLARTETVDGITCKAGSEVRIDDEGHLSSAVLDGDQRIGGISCRGGEEVGFSGQHLFDHCILSAPSAIMGVVWPAGSKMTNLGYSQLLDASLPPNSPRVVMGDITLVGRCDVHLNQYYELFIKAQDKTAYAEMSNKRYSQLDVMSDGEGSGILATDAKVDGVIAQAGTKLELFCLKGGECHPLESFK